MFIHSYTHYTSTYIGYKFIVYIFPQHLVFFQKKKTQMANYTVRNFFSHISSTLLYNSLNSRLKSFGINSFYLTKRTTTVSFASSFIKRLGLQGESFRFTY